MQLKTIVATAFLPLLAVADDSTLTSTLTMTKYVTISKVSTSSVYANATTPFHYPTGTGYSSVITTTTTTSTEGGSSPTLSSPTVSPTIDNGNGGSSGAGSLSAFGFAGVAGMVLAALM
ncbi:hypothetical protein F5X97DRAFT_297665 [Nemania serpens]|nr:hypothetical protein F5X97DRAFT_297665 [Nemania serpens]